MAEWIVRAESLSDLINGRFTASTKPLTRCEDCKYADWFTTIKKECFCYCRKTGAIGRTQDDFCSSSKRREEGDAE